MFSPSILRITQPAVDGLRQGPDQGSQVGAGRQVGGHRAGVSNMHRNYLIRLFSLTAISVSITLVCTLTKHYQYIDICAKAIEFITLHHWFLHDWRSMMRSRPHYEAECLRKAMKVVLGIPSSIRTLISQLMHYTESCACTSNVKYQHTITLRGLGQMKNASLKLFARAPTPSSR